MTLVTKAHILSLLLVECLFPLGFRNTYIYIPHLYFLNHYSYANIVFERYTAEIFRLLFFEPTIFLDSNQCRHRLITLWGTILLPNYSDKLPN